MRFFINNIDTCTYFPYRHAHICGACIEIREAGNEYFLFKRSLYKRINKMHVSGTDFTDPPESIYNDNHVVFVVNNEYVIEFSDSCILIGTMNTLMVDR